MAKKEYRFKISGVHYAANPEAETKRAAGHGGDACAHARTFNKDRPRKTTGVAICRAYQSV